MRIRLRTQTQLVNATSGKNLLEKICTVLLCVFSSVTVSSAQVSLSAKPVTTSKSSHTSWQTTWGSHDTTTTRSRIIEVELFNTSSQTQTVRLAFHVFSGNPPRLFALEILRATAILSPGRKLTVPFEAAPVKKRVEEYRALRETYVSGTEPSGWIVLGVTDSQRLVAASTEPFRSFGVDPQKLDPLVAAYDKRLSAQSVGYAEAIARGARLGPVYRN